MSQKVVATKQGFHGGIIRDVGAVFDIGDKEKLGKWMLPYKDGDPIPTKDKPKQMGDTRPLAAREAAAGRNAQLHKGNADLRPPGAQAASAAKSAAVHGTSPVPPVKKDDAKDLA